MRTQELQGGRVGDPDGDPEVELQFKAYVPFTREFWRWIGETSGQEVHMAFPSSLGKAVTTVAPAQQASLIEDEPSAAEEEAFSGDDDEEDLVAAGASRKSGPKDLAKFHEAELEKSATRSKKR